MGGDHLVLYVDRLVRHPNSQVEKSVSMVGGVGRSSLESCCSSSAAFPSADLEGKRDDEGGVKYDNDGIMEGEDEALLLGGGQTYECRICQEEDRVHNLEIPCTCRGSLKYAHRKCVQRWCNEKGDITCEICHQAYQPGYTAPPPPPPPPQPDEAASIDIGGGWTVSGTPLDLHDPRLLALAEAERQFFEAEYDDYAASSASGAAFCRSAALILMALLLLRHALTVPDTDGDDDASAFFSLFLLRAAGFLLPCYIMAWAISILQRRRQRQEAAAMAATQVAFMLQSGQHRGLQFTIAPRPSPSLPHHDSV